MSRGVSIVSGVSSGLRGASGTALGEDGFGFFHRVGFTASLRCKALVEVGANGVAVAQEPVFGGLLGLFRQFQEVCDQGGRLGVRAARKLALEAGFGGGIENERHAKSITPGRAMRSRGGWRAA